MTTNFENNLRVFLKVLALLFHDHSQCFLSHDALLMNTDQWCRRRGYRGCKRTPKTFDISKIRKIQKSFAPPKICFLLHLWHWPHIIKTD